MYSFSFRLMRTFCVIVAIGLMSKVNVLSQPFDDIHKIFSQYDSLDSPGCAVLIIQNDEIVFKYGYGSANLEHNAPITPNTIFYIGSISKQFTAMCIVLLEEQGKLSLNDDIRTYLPELPEYENTIRIRDLIYHTNGLQQYFDLWEKEGRSTVDVLNAKHVMNLLKNAATLSFKPGEKYSYSNSGYFLLSQIVERISEKSFSDFAEQHIFKPLEMNNSHFHTDCYQIIPNRAMSYFKREDGSYGVYMLNYEVVGPGGIYTSVEDLAKWDQNFYNNKLGKGKQSLINRTLECGELNNGNTLNYAFGLKIVEYKGIDTVEHGGSLAGYKSHFLRFPEKKPSIIILGNLKEMEPYNLTVSILDIILN